MLAENYNVQCYEAIQQFQLRNAVFKRLIKGY